MLKFDFSNSQDLFLNTIDVQNLLEKKESVFSKLDQSSMAGWRKPIDPKIIDKIFCVRDMIRKNSQCLVVIGIGGSFLGSYALNEIVCPTFQKEEFPIIYAGTTLSSSYMKELLDYLETVDFSVNVISKSGTTLETTLTYQLIRELMEKKYSKEEVKQRIIITTDEVKGTLREEVLREQTYSFVIPEDIGGRYSLLTAAHLFPLSFSFDIQSFIQGYYQGLQYIDEAYQYAVIRRLLFGRGKQVENFCVYEPRLYYFTEWLKQLFGETEGKEKKGIFPVSTVHTRDLHSLGQFIQEGNPILFETFLKITKEKEKSNLSINLHKINRVVLDSVLQAHCSGGVPCNVIELEQLDENNLGQICGFFLLSAAFSGYLFDVDPFNQPGVEVYKKFVRENLTVEE